MQSTRTICVHSQVDSCCILFEYSLMHAYEGISGGTRVLTQTVPVSIFHAKSFACTRRAKHG